MNDKPGVSEDRYEALPVSRTVFAAWSAFFIFFIIPLELLFRIDAFLNYLPPVHILFNGLFTLLLYVAISFGLALLSLLIYTGLRPILTRKVIRKRFVLTANFTVILLGFIYKTLNTSVVWCKAVTHWSFDTGRLSTFLVVASLVTAVAVVLTKPHWVADILVVARYMFRPIVAMFVATASIIAVSVVAILSARTQGSGQSHSVQSAVAGTMRPNVILITLDALSANDMSLYGYHLRTTPNLELFSKCCYLFEHAYANSNFTTPGIASILTSKYPIKSRIYNYFNFLAPEIRRENLAHELHQSGYQTVALFANIAGHPYHYGAYLDFDKAPQIDFLHRIDSLAFVANTLLSLEHLGFHPYPWFGERIALIFSKIESSLLMFLPDERAARDQVYSRQPDITLKLAAKYLRRAPRPVFLWVHLLAPHAPYLPTASFKYRFLPEKIFATASSQQPYINSYYEPDQQPLIDKLRLRYDEHIASADEAVGQFLHDLSKDGYLDNSMIIIASDHGEQFEKGYHEHGGTGYMGLYQPLVHIPLLIHLPGQTSPRRVSGNVEQVDIAPTILSSLNLPVPGWMEGESLVPSMRDGHSSGRPKFAMNLELCSPRRPVDDGSIAVLQDSDKYIYYVRRQEGELFDLAKDPHEEVNLAAKFPEKAKEMNRLALQRLGLVKKSE
ncbi:MAG TPA: sulfatase [Lacunisphaera sp.]|jgi:arylsulfatase A-like enzyme|nr:sulfatase [Lacunisphaera sp.]